LNNAKDVVTPLLFAVLQNLTIPEVDFDGGYLKNIEVHIEQPSVKNINIAAQSAANAVELTANTLDATMSSDFKYKWLFVTATGTADIKMSDISLDMELGLGTQVSNTTGELAPKLAVKKSDINVDPSKVDIKLTGSLVAKIASVFIPLFKSTIIPDVIKTVQQQITEIVDNQIDTALMVNGTQITIPYLSGVTVDFAQMNNGPTVTSNSVLEMSVNGTIFDDHRPRAISELPASFNVHDPAGKTFQAYLTDYVVNSAFDASYSTGAPIDVTHLLSLANVTVTTDDIGTVFPEVLTKYGSGKNVSIDLQFVNTTSSAHITSEVEATLYVNVGMQVEGQAVMSAEFDALRAVATFSSKDGIIYGGISNYTLGEVINFISFIDGVTKEQVVGQLQKEVDTLVDQANKNLTAGIQIPPFLGIEIADADLQLHPGYVSAGFNVTAAQWFQI
jgi:hypothetical protein